MKSAKGRPSPTKDEPESKEQINLSNQVRKALLILLQREQKKPELEQKTRRKEFYSSFMLNKITRSME